MATDGFVETGSWGPSAEICIYADRAYYESDPVQIKKGQKMVAGTILGKIDNTNDVVEYAAGNADGSEVPIGILDRDVDATDKTLGAGCYTKGPFYESKLGGLNNNFDANAKTLLRGLSHPGDKVSIG